MKQRTPARRRVAAALLWLTGGAAGWMLVTGAFWNASLYTYRDVALALPGYLLVGALAGAATGLGQALAWRLLGRPARRWLWASVAGYGLALPAGLIIFTLLPVLTGLRTGFPYVLPWSEPGSVNYYPFPSALIYAGFVAGLCQWAALRPFFNQSTPAMRLLWVFGVWLGIGLGLFAGGAMATLILRGVTGTTFALLWGANWGATIGAVSGGILWVLRRGQAPAPQPDSTAGVAA